MYTPAHLIFGATLFAKSNQNKVIVAALVGGLLPDLSLYVLASWSVFVSGNSLSYVFDTQYFSDAWQTVFAIDNSLFVWLGLLAVAAFSHRPWAIVFAAAGLLHLAFDFPLHHDDGRAHFWPVSDWVFQSPVSYWDWRHYGNIVSPIETALVALCTYLLWRRFLNSRWRWVFILIASLQIAPAILFGLMSS